MLRVTPITALSDNYIWLLRQDTSPGVCVVDPGDAEPVIQLLEQKNLKLETILITHHHGDHTAGLPALIKRYSPSVIGPDNPDIQGLTQRVGDGDSFQVMGRRFDVYAVPGHTLDHIAFFTPGIPPLLFCGDTLFAGGCGRLFEGSPEQMYQSLKTLAALPDDTLIYAAHEYTLANFAFARAADPHNTEVTAALAEVQRARDLDRPTLPSVLSREKLTNPFLRCADANVRATAAQHGDTTTDQATFTTLRAWKDRF